VVALIGCSDARTPTPRTLYAAPQVVHRRRLRPVPRNGSPQRQAHPMRRAGTPATSANGGTSRVTTAPAATKACAPMETPHTTVALAPMVAPAATRVGRSDRLRSTNARGVTTLVNTAEGPTKTSSPSVTPS
jgi:hypothetical protein